MRLASTTHEVEVERAAAGAVVRLKGTDDPEQRLRPQVRRGGRAVEDAVLAHRSARGGFFTLILQPPERVTVEDVTPKELVFVARHFGLDGGLPIEKAKETMKLALDDLYPQDTFNLITFAGDTHILFPEPVPGHARESAQSASSFSRIAYRAAAAPR